MPEPSKYHQHGAQYLSKINENHGCLADAFLERFGAALGCQMLDFGSQNLQNITKMANQIVTKPMKNRGCVADAFWERFGSVPGSQKALPSSAFGCLLATIFDQKSKKWHPKKHAKIDAEKVSKNHEKSIKNDAKMDAKINDF